ncbi:hypothetical protein M3J09_002967 [Ascochyta lentis]
MTTPSTRNLATQMPTTPHFARLIDRNVSGLRRCAPSRYTHGSISKSLLHQSCWVVL